MWQSGRSCLGEEWFFFLKGGGQLVIEYFGELIVQNLVSNSIKLDEKIKIMRSVFR